MFFFNLRYYKIKFSIFTVVLKIILFTGKTQVKSHDYSLPNKHRDCTAPIHCRLKQLLLDFFFPLEILAGWPFLKSHPFLCYYLNSA